MGCLHVHVLGQFVFVEMFISCKRDICDFLPLAFHDSIEDGHTIRPDLSFGCNLDIEEALFTKIR